MKYFCESCKQEHEGWPTLAYSSPVFYDYLSEDEKNRIAKINNDFCLIKHQDQEDKFIRCTLTQKVNDHCQNLEYGLWVSLSDTSYNDYHDNYDSENHETKYFGWLSNDLYDYEDTTKIPTTVFTRTGNQRPEIVPHQDFDHQFVKDYYNGITKEEAERRIDQMLKNSN